MPVTLDVQTQIDRASVQKAADQIAAIVKQAVIKGLRDGLHEAAVTVDASAHTSTAIDILINSGMIDPDASR